MKLRTIFRFFSQCDLCNSEGCSSIAISRIYACAKRQSWCSGYCSQELSGGQLQEDIILVQQGNL